MREIKFRGKDIESGEWIYGSLDFSMIRTDKKSNAKIRILNKRFGIWVNPETVGEFIKKKDDIDLYEGDICKFGNIVFSIEYNPHYCGFGFYDENRGWVWLYDILRSFQYKLEKIGNKYDNPELMGE